MTSESKQIVIQTVDRADIEVLYLEVSDDLPQIQLGWQRLEETIGELRGRHFMATVDVPARQYRVCVERHEDDDPAALGLAEGVVLGGRYLRGRLRGEPPGVYELIAPTCDLLASRITWDTSRPVIEHYRRRDEIDVCVPVAADVTIPREVVDPDVTTQD